MLGITLAAPGDETMVMSLARDHQLSVYDATYLELATREGHTLCTFDEKLRAAAGKCGVSLLPG
ncbi:MAG: type II toxin-antitoxin system VapC family toxin [Phycisphaeraceae bacterium]